MSTRVLSCPGKRVEAKCGEIHHQVATESMQLLTNQQPEFGEGGGASGDPSLAAAAFNLLFV